MCDANGQSEYLNCVVLILHLLVIASAAVLIHIEPSSSPQRGRVQIL